MKEPRQTRSPAVLLVRPSCKAGFVEYRVLVGRYNLPISTVNGDLAYQFDALLELASAMDEIESRDLNIVIAQIEPDVPRHLRIAAMQILTGKGRNLSAVNG